MTLSKRYGRKTKPKELSYYMTGFMPADLIISELKWLVKYHKIKGNIFVLLAPPGKKSVALYKKIHKENGI